MPYRIDITGAHPDVLDRLVQLGALDVEPVGDGIAAILPDGVEPDSVSAALGGARVIVSAAVARDNGSVWLLNPRPVQIGGVLASLYVTVSDTFGLKRSSNPCRRSDQEWYEGMSNRTGDVANSRSRTGQKAGRVQDEEQLR